MHGASDISHSVGWPLSHRGKACWERKSPMPKERACIPDNWLCISDWQITHRLVFGQSAESEGEKRERHVAGSHIPFLLKKYKALWPHVRCRWKAVFILKQKQTLTQLSTPKHIHPHSWRLAHRVLLFLTPALLTSVSQRWGESTLHVPVKKASIFN